MYLKVFETNDANQTKSSAFLLSRKQKIWLRKKERRKEGHSFSGKSKKKKKTQKRTICTYEKLAFVLFVFVRSGEIVHKVRKEEFILGMAIANRFTGCSFGTMVIGYKITVRCKNIFKKFKHNFFIILIL